MSDILIGIAGSASTASNRSRNKASNYCSICLPRHGGGSRKCFVILAWEAYFLDWM